MRALSLKGENFKRLSVVEIELKKGLNEITGKNGNGKTSVLDLFTAILEGQESIQWEPIKKGADHAIGVLDLGDDSGLKFRVTRRFKKSEEGGKTFTTEVKIEDAGGKRLPSPQAMLDLILGPGRTLDPIAFAQAKPAERIDLLKSLVPDFDFDKAAKNRDTFYEARTAQGRESKRLQGLIDSLPVVVDAPDMEVDVSALAKELQAAIAENNALAEEGRRRERLQEDLIDLVGEAAELNHRLERLKAEIASNKAATKALEIQINSSPPLAGSIKTDTISDQIDTAEEVNRRVRAKLERKKAVEDHAKSERVYADLTESIDAIDEGIRKAVEEAELPVRGMTIGERDVMLKGLPFDQASDAEQLRASMAIAMASEPDLRLIRIRDGNGIDEDGMKVIAEVAEADDFQIIMERVTPSAEGAAIIIEDGRVKK